MIAIPLVTKGMAEVEGSNKDMNYFLGIRQTDSVLTADFEDTATGLNHPVAGVTAIPANGAWHHAAATYDGTTWRLYLDGVLDAQLVVGAFTPRADSIQHATLGTALNSTGVVTSGQTAGFFDGVVDEARVWNYARTLAQISRGKNFEIANAPGLLGRWSFNAGTGTVLADSTGRGINGTVTGADLAWVIGVPFPTQGNAAPTAAADTAATPEDSPVVDCGRWPNDTDADGDVVSVTAAGAALHGTTVRRCERQHHLYAGGQLPRARYVHVRGQRQPGRHQHGDRDRHGHAGQRPGAVVNAGAVRRWCCPPRPPPSGSATTTDSGS